MDIENTLLKIAPILSQTKSFCAGSAVIKMIDPTLNYDIGDIDIYTNGNDNFTNLIDCLSRYFYKYEPPIRQLVSSFICKECIAVKEILIFPDGKKEIKEVGSGSIYSGEEDESPNINDSNYTPNDIIAMCVGKKTVLKKDLIFRIVEFIHPELKYKLQCIGYNGEYKTILNNFDLDICRATWDPNSKDGKIIGLESTPESLKLSIKNREAKCFRFMNENRRKKYTDRGFKITPDDK